MLRGGRPKNPIWDKYNKKSVGGKIVAECKLCKLQQAPRCERMQRHQLTCGNKENIQTPHVFQSQANEVTSVVAPPAKKTILEKTPQNNHLC